MRPALALFEGDLSSLRPLIPAWLPQPMASGRVDMWTVEAVLTIAKRLDEMEASRERLRDCGVFTTTDENGDVQAGMRLVSPKDCNEAAEFAPDHDGHIVISTTVNADLLRDAKAEIERLGALADQLADALRDEARNHTLRGNAARALDAHEEARRG
jgi:hypothetical protein